jgi:hypothetical protein
MSLPQPTTPQNESQSSSPSPVSEYIVETNPLEFSRLIRRSDILHMIRLSFAEAPQPLALLRYYHFLSEGIECLQSDLNKYRKERDAIFNLLNENRNYQVAISPIITEYRRRRQRANQAMETPLTSPIVPPPDLPANHPLQPSPPNSPQTVQILPIDETSLPSNELEQLVTAYLTENPPDNESTDNSSTSFKSIEPDQGTQEHPIDVDQGTQEQPIDVDLLPATTIPHHIARLHRTRSMPHSSFCNHCQRTGHDVTNCIWTGSLLCDYCREIGHTRMNCGELRRDIRIYNSKYHYCTICNASGHTTVRCATLLPFND